MIDIKQEILDLIEKHPPPKPDPTNWMANNYPMKWRPVERLVILTVPLPADKCIRLDVV